MFDKSEARLGRLPGSQALKPAAQPAGPACILLLGAAWVILDYFHHINGLRHELKASFACVLHDLIPIYARETCDQGTADVFKAFLATSRLSTDAYLCVSENTLRDLMRYFDENAWQRPQASVIPHATALPPRVQPIRPAWFTEDPNGFVLNVSTIEGRKNHALLFATWQRLKAEHPHATPKLICVGRPGWRAADFLLRYLSSEGLAGKIEIHSDVSDGELAYLYEQCRFTVYPSFYEGWGLPISESFAYGKLCICSDTSAMPEAGDRFARFIDPHDHASAFEVIAGAINDPQGVAASEALIASEFKPRSWSEVASDYLDAVNDVALLPRTPPAARIPSHLVYRCGAGTFDGVLGQELVDRIAAFLRSDLKPGPVTIASFENAHLSRGPGTWMAPESWGCWIGLDGATVRLLAEREEEVYAYISYVVMPMFHGNHIKIMINNTQHSVQASYTGLHGLMVLKFTARAGWNTIRFLSNANETQRSASLEMDGRGLMLGLREIVCLPKSDLEGRLELLQTASLI